MKCNNISIVGITEGEESEQRLKNLFEEIMTKNFLNLVKKKDTQVQEAQRFPNKMDPQRPTPRHIIIKMAKFKENKRIPYDLTFNWNIINRRKKANKI